MAKKDLSTLTDQELESKLKIVSTIAATTTGIFIVIILVWLLLGYWKSNVPVFISTICVAVVSSSSQYAIRQGIRKEIEKRRTFATDSEELRED